MKQRVFLILVVAILFISGTALGTQNGFLKFKADCNMEIVGEPKIHEPFEAIFTFTPLEDLVHTRGIPDSAFFVSEDHINYLKGDTLWTGELENGQTYTLRAWFVVNDPVYFRVQGSIRTKGVPGVIPVPNGTFDPGANAYNGKGSKLFDFREPYSRKPEDIYYLSDDSTGWIAPYVSPILEPKSNLIGNGSPIVAKMKPDSRENMDSNHLETSSVDTNYIYITAMMLEANDTIKFNSKKINILRVSRDLRDKLNIEVDGNSILRKINHSKYLIDNIGNESIIKINYQGKTYTPPVELLTLYNICGSASFVDNDYNVQNVRNVLVEHYNCLNSDCSSTEFAGYTYTIVEFKYKGGPAPMADCINLY